MVFNLHLQQDNYFQLSSSYLKLKQLYSTIKERMGEKREELRKAAGKQTCTSYCVVAHVAKNIFGSERCKTKFYYKIKFFQHHSTKKTTCIHKLQSQYDNAYVIRPRARISRAVAERWWKFKEYSAFSNKITINDEKHCTFAAGGKFSLPEVEVTQALWGTVLEKNVCLKVVKKCSNTLTTFRAVCRCCN